MYVSEKRFHNDKSSYILNKEIKWKAGFIVISYLHVIMEDGKTHQKIPIYSRRYYPGLDTIIIRTENIN